MDGYQETEKQKNTDFSQIENYNKFLELQELQKNQNRIDDEIANLSKEIKDLPEPPHNIDDWCSSFNNKFKISDYKKMFNINRQYKKLLDERKENTRKIKIFAIENIIERINETVKKE